MAGISRAERERRLALIEPLRGPATCTRAEWLAALNIAMPCFAWKPMDQRLPAAVEYAKQILATLPDGPHAAP